jgi:hypothetical protein
MQCFWTGYFTSRPTLKLQERSSSMFLQSLKQLTTMSLLSSSKVDNVNVEKVKESVFQLTAAVGLLNHHDALTGTSKQHVADDYSKILAAGMTTAESVVGSVLAANTAVTPRSGFSACRLVNETVCSASQSLSPGQQMLVTVYNPLARARTSQVTVPINFPAAKVSLADGSDTSVQSTVLPSNNQSPNANAAPFVLTFTAEALPALSTKGFYVEVMEDTSSTGPVAAKSASVRSMETDDEITLTNGIVTVVFDKTTGLMSSITRNDLNNISASVSNDLGYYLSFGTTRGETPLLDDRDPHLQNIKPAAHNVGSTSSQRSGAYIFRYIDCIDF